MEPDLTQTQTPEPKAPTKGAKGGLPLGLVATIQKMYRQNQNNQLPPTKAGPINTGLQHGWGGADT